MDVKHDCDKNNSKESAAYKQRILVFQQDGRGECKIEGIKKYGKKFFVIEVIAIDTRLPPVLDDARTYLPQDFSADLVLDYLMHPDLSCELAEMCAEKRIPMIASGKKLSNKWAVTPVTCCALSRQAGLGVYGDRFGAPEFDVKISNGKIAAIKVLRGAPCGATWEAAKRMKYITVGEASMRIGLETQYYCCANPAGWDPISGKSPLHFAGAVHSRALSKALRQKENKVL